MGDSLFHALETMLDSIVLTTAVRGDHGQIVDFVVDYINPVAEIGQRPAKQIVGRRFLDVWPSTTESPIWGIYLELMETGEPIVLDNFVYRDVIDGEPVTAVFDIRATKLGDGFLQNFRDVTERYQKQQELAASESEARRAEGALQPGEEWLRASLEALQDGFAIFSAVRDSAGAIADFRYEYINEAGCQMDQRSREETIGHTLAELFPATATSGVVAAYGQVVETGEPLAADCVGYEDVHTRGWKTGAFELRIIKVGDGIVANWRGVADHRKAEKTTLSQAAALGRSQAELEDRVQHRIADLVRSTQELEDFNYSVAHDLRAPLRAIHGYCQILLDEYAARLDEDGQVLLSRVGHNAERMGQLIEGLLALARVGHKEPRLIRLDMTTLVRSVVADLRTGYAGSWPAVTVSQLADGTGDPGEIRQVWEHLIGNAVKFSANRADATVSVKSQSTPGEVTYHVRDNGVGFDMTHAGKLFGIFQRLHPADFPGTGISLAIVARIVDHHGGRAWADGRPGIGACFSFALPVAPAEGGKTP